MLDMASETPPMTESRVWPAWSLAALVLVLSLGIGASGMARWQSARLASGRAAAAHVAHDRAFALERGVERMLGNNYALAALVHQANGKVEHFESAAAQLLAANSQLLAVSLSPGGVVRHVAPLQGNESLWGFDQLNDPAQRREAIFARDTARLTLAGPLPLAQGGMGIVSRLPVFLKDAAGQPQFWGFANVSIRLSDLLGKLRFDELNALGYDYRLWRLQPDTGQVQVIAASLATSLRDPVRESLEVPNGAWNLDLAPSRGWVDVAALAWVAAVLFLASVLLAMLTHHLVLARLRRQALEVLARERQLELLASRHQLQSVVEAIRDPIFEIGLDGVYHGCHVPAGSVLPAPADELVGRTVFEVLPQAAAETTMEALRCAHAEGFSQGEEYALELAHGTHWFELSVARKESDAAEPRFVVMTRDITGSKSAKSEIRRLAFYDPLTDLPNRRLLQDRLEHAQTRSGRNGRHGALLLIDLDNFKALNDTWGHDKGDLLLKQVALRLTACVRDSDTVARLGGDEFVVLIDDAGAIQGEVIATARAVADKVLAQLGEPFDVDGRVHRSGCSIGVSLFGFEPLSGDEVLKRADVAMYQAKGAGRNTVRFFDPAMQSAVEARSALESDLRQGLAHQAFALHYQPQIGAGGKVIGAEALLRWTHPQRGAVSPAEFIPVAEQSGLIVDIGEWVLHSACVQLARWADMPAFADLTLAINVSVHQFRQADFVDKVRRALLAHGTVPARLKLEITESMFAYDLESIINKMHQLKALGVGFSLDDFGTGYSSLSYLRRLPLDQLKIDQSFVREVLSDPNDAAIARTIIALGQSLGLMVIAEGVELQGQRDFLAEFGCDCCQGYLISRPLPVQDFDAFVQARSTPAPAAG
jgi:diguanylate cyclase (GGDEF)-like protein